jgi:hypothetical protein
MMRLRLLAFAAAISASTAGCVKTTMTSPTEVVASDPDSFSSLLVPGGSAGRELALTVAGRITVTLTSTSPAGIVVGVGIGIPRADSSCALATGVETAAGAAGQVSVAAEPGRYCVKVYDPGRLGEALPFTLSISRP